ncbi:MAG TPA: sigma factor-like helix-turn-helix DNA-binding protein [Vicinamibacterales bacterium]|nr:sigma factor-like helix-turn-helix DNA-binding protein [Vicinamibacterales bacterium]
MVFGHDEGKPRPMAALAQSILARVQLSDPDLAVTGANVAAIARTLHWDRPSIADGRKRALRLLLRAQGVQAETAEWHAELEAAWERIQSEVPRLDEGHATRSDVLETTLPTGAGASEPPWSGVLAVTELPLVPRLILRHLPPDFASGHAPKEDSGVCADAGWSDVSQLLDLPISLVVELDPGLVDRVRGAVVAHLDETLVMPGDHPVDPRGETLEATPTFELNRLGISQRTVDALPPFIRSANDVVRHGLATIASMGGVDGAMLFELAAAVDFAILGRVAAGLAPGRRPTPFDLTLLPRTVLELDPELQYLRVPADIDALVPGHPFQSIADIGRLKRGTAIHRFGARETSRLERFLTPFLSSRYQSRLTEIWMRRPRANVSVSLESLGLDATTRRRLRAARVRDLRDLADTAMDDFARRQGVGYRRVANLLAWLEYFASHPASAKVLDEPMTVIEPAAVENDALSVKQRAKKRLPLWARRLVGRRRAVLRVIRMNDLRYGSTRLDERSILAALEQDGPTEPVLGALRRVYDNDPRPGPPSAELIEALQSRLSRRQADVLVGRWGLAGGRPKTLEQLGRGQAVTRERVRQIEKKARDAIGWRRTYLPGALRARKLLLRNGRTLSRMEYAEILGAERLGGTAADLAALKVAATLEWIPEIWAVEDGTIWTTDRSVTAKIAAVRDEIGTMIKGRITVTFSGQEVVDALAAQGTAVTLALVRAVASGNSRLLALSDDLYARRPGKDAVPRHAAKILKTAGRPLAMGQILRALRRDPRYRNSAELLVERELRNSDWFELSDGRWHLTGQAVIEVGRTAEIAAAKLLGERGPLLGQELFGALVQSGLGESSAKVAIGQSSLIQRWPGGVYTQVGARPTPGEIAAAFERRSPTTSRPVQVDHLATGGFVLTVEYTAARRYMGVFSVGNRAPVQGDWTGNSDGTHHTYRVRADHGLIWGVGPWIREVALREGDMFTMTFDPMARRVALAVARRSPLDPGD